MNQAHNVARIALAALAALISASAIAHVDTAHGVLGLFGALPHAHESGANAFMAMLPYAASFLLTACLLIGKSHLKRKSLPQPL